MKRKREAVPRVAVSRRISGFIYSALQRYAGQNGINIVDAIESGLASLPATDKSLSMNELIKEEQEAYAKIIKEDSSQEAAVAKEADRFDEEHHNPRNPR